MIQCFAYTKGILVAIELIRILPLDSVQLYFLSQAACHTNAQSFEGATVRALEHGATENVVFIACPDSRLFCDCWVKLNLGDLFQK